MIITSPALAMYEATTVGVTVTTIMGIKQKIDCEKEHQKNGKKAIAKIYKIKLTKKKLPKKNK